MAKFQNFSVQQTVTVDKVYRACRVGLEKCIADFGTDKFRRAFKNVMGGAGDVRAIKAAESVLESEIEAMHLRIATVSFSVAYNPAFGAHTNVDMSSFGGAAVGMSRRSSTTGARGRAIRR
jgi:hypothetical protein